MNSALIINILFENRKRKLIFFYKIYQINFSWLHSLLDNLCFFQCKNQLIASLPESSGASGDAAGVSHLEYDTVKQVNNLCKEEIQQYRMTMDNPRVERSVNLH